MNIDENTDQESIEEVSPAEDNSMDVIDINLDEELKSDTSNAYSKTSGKDLTVFVVDDDNFLLEMYVKKFKNSGFEIMSSGGGEDTLTKIRNGANPDIFIFDLVMPQMDGLELIKHIQTENLIPKATKIVLSNQGQQTDIQKAEEIGVDGYIVKALHTPSEIVELVIKTHKEKNK